MKTKCLILNRREPISEDVLKKFEDRLSSIWFQSDEFSLEEALY